MGECWGMNFLHCLNVLTTSFVSMAIWGKKSRKQKVRCYGNHVVAVSCDGSGIRVICLPLSVSHMVEKEERTQTATN